MTNQSRKEKSVVITTEENFRNYKNRKTGIDVIGDIPWGTHLCQFYQTKQDLIDTLVPYFKAGLENNEFCMWVCWDPLQAEKARTTLSKTLESLDNYIKKGQIEIVDYNKRHKIRGNSGFSNMKQFWIEKEKLAFERGFDGLRLAGNTHWLKCNEWEDFSKYEEEVDSIIKDHKMLAICPYSLDKCGASKILDVMKNHQFALIKREGKWEVIESAERKKAEKKIKIFSDAMAGAIDGIAILDMKGTIIYTNPSIEKMHGYKKGELIGKHASVFDPSLKRAKQIMSTLIKTGDWTGEIFSQKKNKETFPSSLSLSTIKNEKGKPVAIMGAVRDITELKQAQEMKLKYHLTVSKEKLQKKIEKLKQKMEMKTTHLQKMNKELEKIAKIKSEFLADISHELRTPLTILQGNIELASFVNKREQKKILNTIKDEINRMSKMINNLSLITRVDSGELPLSLKKMKLDTFIKKTIEKLPHLDRIKIKQLDTIKVSIYPDQLTQLLFNLIDNSLTHSGKNTQITVSLRKLRRQAKLTIADNGKGIAKKELPYIFDRFYQGKRTHRSFKKCGSGLGLAICKCIAEIHRGKIEAKSDKGKGFKVNVYLPL